MKKITLNAIARLLSVIMVLIVLLSAIDVVAHAENWVCPNCGNSADGNFCSVCGASKPSGSSSWYCPNCGSLQSGNFCSNCGQSRSNNTVPHSQGISRASYLGRNIIIQGSAYANEYFTYTGQGGPVPYYPFNAFDNNKNTCWVTYAYTNSSTRIYLGNSWTLNSGYQNSYKARGIVITTGLQTRGQDSFTANSRPALINVSINGINQSFLLEDTMSEQTCYFSSTVTPVNGRFDLEIQVLSVYTGDIHSGRSNRIGEAKNAVSISDVDLLLE